MTDAVEVSRMKVIRSVVGVARKRAFAPQRQDSETVQAELKTPRELTLPEIENWRQLQRGAPWLDSPFFSPEFTLAVGAARPDTRVALLKKGGEIVGYFPFHLTSRSIAKPVGGPMSDYQGPILATAADFTSPELLKACGLRAYDFNHCPADLHPIATGLTPASASPRIVFRTGYADYLSAAAPRTRDSVKKVDRRMRKMEREAGPVVFRFDDQRDQSWDWLVQTKSKALEKSGAKAGFSIPWIARLHDTLRGIHTADFSGLLSTISCGEILVAAHFGMRAGTVLNWWHTTYDENYRQYAPGLALLLSIVREGAGQGIDVLDLGRGTQRYKIDFSNEEFQLCEGAVAQRGSIAAVLRKGQSQVSDLAHRLPLGQYASIPGRAVGRFISNVRLP
jgi:CelD/BcsL family acetyltransferase involved in cellulose biosynthesis